MMKTMTTIGMTLAMSGAALGQDWVETQRLTAESATMHDVFGFSVAIDGDTLVAGAAQYDGSFSDQGAVYVFVRESGAWTPSALLLDPDASDFDMLGFSVALNGNRAVVGAVGSSIAGFSSGKAVVLERIDEVWQFVATLTAADASERAQFGSDIAIDGDRIAVGDYRAAEGEDITGAVYIFEFDGTAWAQTAKLVPSDATDGDAFGASIALQGNTLVAGSVNARVGDTRPGAAYIFQVEDGQWVEKTKLLGGDVQDGDYFGASVALDADSLLIGAERFGEGTSTDQPGAVFPFELVGSEWIAGDTIVPIDPDTRGFGTTTLQGDTAVVGALYSGDAYVYSKSSGAWTLEQSLEPKDLSGGHLFGNDVGISGETIVVGAMWAPGAAFRAGAAYIFEPNPCPADLDGDGTLTIFDFLAFQNAFDAMEPVADFDGDGDFTIFDFLAFQNAFDAGCP